jgi:hypothetical protein
VTGQLYQSLSVLQLGQVVPLDVYVLDYANGERATWTVVAREVLGAGGVKLVLHDQENGDLFSCPQVIVQTFPAKTLRTQPHLSDLGPNAINKLCDLAQQARYIEKVKRSGVTTTTVGLTADDAKTSQVGKAPVD